MFNIFANKGFQIQFNNGWKISVMFGAGNYCEHRFNENIEPGKDVPIWNRHSSQDAEIAVFDPQDNFSSFPGCPEGDHVVGWNSADQMLEIMNWVAQQ